MRATGVRWGVVGAMVLCGAVSADAGFIGLDDQHAMPDWKGAERIESIMPVIAVDVRYAVFAPGQFELSYPGMDPSAGTEYVYAYQLYNDIVDHPANSNGWDPDYVSRFSVGLDTDEGAGNATYLTGTGIDPTSVDILNALSTQVGWDFTENQLAYPSVGAILLFTSPQGPEMDSASVSGWLGASGVLPSPAPEPGTLGLLGVGLAWVVARLPRRRRT